MANYPSVEKIIELNLLALTVIKVKKADTPKVLSRSKIAQVIKECEEKEGDLFDKAAELLKGITQKHPFASGNRRTAFIATKHFLETNGQSIGISDEPQSARVMLGIREKYYTDEEIKEWIKNGKIREFKR